MLKNVQVQDYRNPATKYQLPYREKRDCYKQLEDYIQSEYQQKVCAIYGLRRTGKTVLMQQCIENMSKEDRNNTLLLTCQQGSDLYDILSYIDEKMQEGYKYFFIDEITYADNFQNIGEALANNYVAMKGAKVVITGTDSLGISLPSHNLQYNRTEFVRTTYTSFAEYARLTGNDNLDDYIRYGGLLVPDTFSDYYSTHEYIETSIVDNLIHSLEKSEGIQKYPATLSELYDANELKNAIERIVNGYSQNLTAKAIRKEFKSAPVFTAIKNITKAKENPDNIREYFDYENVNRNIAEALGILKNEELSINITETHKKEIYSFLREMDVFTSIPVLDAINGQALSPIEMVSHPGMFHANLEHALSELQKQDNWYPNASSEQKDRMLANAYESAIGEIMENIIIRDVYQMLCGNEKTTPNNFLGLDTTEWYVSKLTVTLDGKIHESDMIVANKEKHTAYLFEIKHSKENVKAQSMHLENDTFLQYVRDNFGEIRGRAVLYNGDTDRTSTVPRLSANKFLNVLYSEIINESRKGNGKNIDELLDIALMNENDIENRKSILYNYTNSTPINMKNKQYDNMQSVLKQFENKSSSQHIERNNTNRD